MELRNLLKHIGHKLEISYWGKPDNPETVTFECADCKEVVAELNDAEDGDIVVGPIDEFVTDGPRRAYMPTCQECKGDRIMSVSAKCADLCSAMYHGVEHDGYVPKGISIDRFGDYVDVTFCLDCGQLQGKWPIPDPDQREWSGFKPDICEDEHDR